MVDAKKQISNSNFQQHMLPLILIVMSFCHATLVRSAPAATAAVTPVPGTRRDNPRWHSPCAGSSPVETTRDWTNVRIKPLHPARHFHNLARRTRELKKRVRQLTQLYINQRFRDDDYVEDLEDITLAGMPAPKVGAHPVRHRASDSSRVAQSAIGLLSRAAVFIEQARLDEMLYSPTRHSYLRNFQEIEDQGIYWLLCELHRYMIDAGETPNRDVTHDVMSVNVRDITTRANRHVRDYIVLRDLQKLLYKLNVDFEALKRAHDATGSGSGGRSKGGRNAGSGSKKRRRRRRRTRSRKS